MWKKVSAAYPVSELTPDTYRRSSYPFTRLFSLSVVTLAFLSYSIFLKIVHLKRVKVGARGLFLGMGRENCVAERLM
jgi:hypothetical protein